MRAARNIRRPHCRDRIEGESESCSLVKSVLGTSGMIKTK